MNDRRTVVRAALLLGGAILAGVLFTTLLSDPGEPDRTTTAAGDDAVVERPEIVPKPNSGVAPEDPGDRGGSEQLALLGLVVVAIVGIGTVIVRGGGAKAKQRRAAWRAAADADRDGVLDG